MGNDDQHFPKTQEHFAVDASAFVLKNARLDGKVMFASQKFTIFTDWAWSWHVTLRERLRHVFSPSNKDARIGSLHAEHMHGSNLDEDHAYAELILRFNGDE